MVVIVSGSAVHHQAVWILVSSISYTTKWSHMKLSLSKYTNALKWIGFIIRVSVLNVREPIGFTFEQRAHLQGNFNLRDLVYRSWRLYPLYIRMRYSVFKVLLELKITNIESFKIVVEVEARKHFTYLEPWRFLWDGRLLNLFLQQFLNELLF